MKLNPLKSASENLAALLTNSSTRLWLWDDIAFGTIQDVTPSAGNNQANSQVTVTGTAKSKMIGSQTIYYKRLSMADLQPGSGAALTIVDGDTHITVHNRILAKYRLVADQVMITPPATVPVGQETLNYGVTPIFGSWIYRGNTLLVPVKNTSQRPATNPANLFTYTGATRNGRKVYWIPPKTFAEIGDAAITSDELFFKLLNQAQPFGGDRPITAANTTIGTAVSGTQSGYAGNTFIDFTPGPNSPFTESGTFIYTRLTFGYSGTFAASGFPESFKTASNSVIHGQIAAFYKVPTNGWTANGSITLLTRRTVNYTVAAGDKMLLQGSPQVSFNWPLL